MRDLWDTRVAQGRGLATCPKKLASLGVKRLMERAIWAQGLRKMLEPRISILHRNKYRRKYPRRTLEICAQDEQTSDTGHTGDVVHNSNIFRLGHSDIWACKNCALKDDIWFMEQHRCKGQSNDSLTM